MKTLTFSLSVPVSLQLDEVAAKQLFVLALVESGHLSQSQGAETLGISRYDLIHLMGLCGFPVSRLSGEEREQERQTLAKLGTVRGQPPSALRRSQQTSRARLPE